MKIAILTDLHYGDNTVGDRRSTLADILLLRAVHRLNRFIRPDVTVVLGDVLDCGDGADAPSRRIHLRGILEKLQCPWIIVPGNHDGSPEAFYRDFPRPADMADLGGVRFLPFIDRDEPGYNASRLPSDIARFDAARQNYAGPIVALQHVCLAPPARANAPYNFLNAPDIIAAMHRNNVALSLSGHHHPGSASIEDGSTIFVTAPGLCESPFAFLVISLEQGRVMTERHELAMPAALELVDWHVHTPMAYCSENMSVPRAIELAHAFGLAGIGFAEHSGQLYYRQELYWNGTCLREGLAAAHATENRMPVYRDMMRSAVAPFVRVGLETDTDFQGRLVLRDDDRRQADYLIGSLHDLPGLRDPACSPARLHDEFLFLLQGMLSQGVTLVAHPFRLFRRLNRPVPESLFAPVVDLLRRHRAAAEVNCHTDEPPAEFFRQCLAAGVKLAFGSDAHNLCEVGEFAPHLRLLREAGFDGDTRDVLLDFRQVGSRQNL